MSAPLADFPSDAQVIALTSCPRCGAAQHVECTTKSGNPVHGSHGARQTLVFDLFWQGCRRGERDLGDLLLRPASIRALNLTPEQEQALRGRIERWTQ